MPAEDVLLSSSQLVAKRQTRKTDLSYFWPLQFGSIAQLCLTCSWIRISFGTGRKEQRLPSSGIRWYIHTQIPNITATVLKYTPNLVRYVRRDSMCDDGLWYTKTHSKSTHHVFRWHLSPYVCECEHKRERDNYKSVFWRIGIVFFIVFFFWCVIVNVIPVERNKFWEFFLWLSEKSEFAHSQLYPIKNCFRINKDRRFVCGF